MLMSDEEHPQVTSVHIMYPLNQKYSEYTHNQICFNLLPFKIDIYSFNIITGEEAR